MTKFHLDRAQFEALAEGEVEEPVRDAWIDHLAKCDHCFEAFDEEWKIRLPGGFRVSDAEAEITSEMPSDIADRVEADLFSKVHVADLAASASWLATTGFLAVILCLLRPLVGFDRAHKQSREVDS